MRVRDLCMAYLDGNKFWKASQRLCLCDDPSGSEYRVFQDQEFPHVFEIDRIDKHGGSEKAYMRGLDPFELAVVLAGMTPVTERVTPPHHHTRGPSHP